MLLLGSSFPLSLSILTKMQDSLKKQKRGYQKYSQSSEQWVSLQKNAYSPMNRPIVKNDHTVFQKNYIMMTFEMISLVFR